MTSPLQFTGVASALIPAGPVHLAIGMFDGVHRGHAAVIRPAVAAARRDHGIAAVLTFWPHPSAIFRPTHATKLIQDSATKARVLGRLGVAVVITEQFTPAFGQIEAEQFLPWLKQHIPTLAAVYIGDNFRFGHGRRGTPTLLADSGRQLGVGVSVAHRITRHGEPVSSTRIRRHLEAGEIEATNALLGYPYVSEGVVGSGKQLGRTIGFPTLNLDWAPELKPRLGVYLVRVGGEAAGERMLPGVANYGIRPTIENASVPKLEVHLIGECPFNPGDRIAVEWLHFIRPEKKFANIEELRAQIARDRDAAAVSWVADETAIGR